MTMKIYTKYSTNTGCIKKFEIQMRYRSRCINSTVITKSMLRNNDIG